MKVYELFESTEDDSSKLSDSDVQKLARVFVQRCKDWDINKPLYRITKRVGLEKTEKRKHGSLAGSGNIWNWMHAQKAWRDFPDRNKSIFCSTTPSIHFGHHSDDDDGGLKVIYPIGNITFAYSPRDFNSNRVSGTSFHGLEAQIRGWHGDMETSDNFSIQNAIERIYAGNIPKDESEGSLIFAKKYADKLVHGADDPAKLNISLETTKSMQSITPKEKDEVWFEGEYIAIPRADAARFRKAVKELQS